MLGPSDVKGRRSHEDREEGGLAQLLLALAPRAEPTEVLNEALSIRQRDALARREGEPAGQTEQVATPRSGTAGGSLSGA
jgi:hypothetical protein